MRAFVILAALALLAAPASAQGESKSVTIDGGELATCSPGDTFCFAISEGDLDGLTGGMEVTLTFRSLGVLPHNVLVTTSANADENRTDTQTDTAIAETATINAGETDTITFVIPAEATGLYLWCDVGDHEEQGMWLEASVAPAMMTSEGGNDTMTGGGDQSDEETDDSPLPVALGLIAFALAALVGRRKA